MADFIFPKHESRRSQRAKMIGSSGAANHSNFQESLDNSQIKGRQMTVTQNLHWRLLGRNSRCVPKARKSSLDSSG